MNAINDFGKNIIRLILSLPDGKLYLLGNNLTGNLFGLDKIGVFLRKEDGCSILVSDNPEYSEKAKQSKRKLVSLLSLLTCLEDEGQIFVIDGDISETFFFYDSDNPIVGNDGTLQYYTYDKGRIEIVNDTYMAKDRLGATLMSGVACSQALSSCMIHFLTGEIYGTETLKKFADNDFKSPEELQYEKEIRYTKRGLLISLIALGISLIFPIISIPLSNKYGISTISGNQFRSIDTSLREIYKDIDSIKRQSSLIINNSVSRKSMNVNKSSKDGHFQSYWLLQGRTKRK